MDYAFSTSVIRLAENALLEQGTPLMEQASFALASHILCLLKERGFRLSGSTVLVLAGTGNNGGDALFAGSYLARRGLKVSAVVGDKCHEEGLHAALRAGVSVTHNPNEQELRSLARDCGTWIDGILGIGVTGKIREPFSNWLSILNQESAQSAAKPLIVAVDIPSGINADSSEVCNDVLKADLTVTMGCLKPALLEYPAADFAGSVETVDLGFDPILFQNASASSDVVLRVNDIDVRDNWLVPTSEDHKYSRGVLGIFTGSQQYPGAGILSVGGASRLGLGMVRYLGGNTKVVDTYPEVVIGNGKIQAALAGSGLVELEPVESWLNELDPALPVVLDAGAISLALDPNWQKPTILTPHAGELQKLLDDSGFGIDRTSIEANPRKFACIAAEHTCCIVVLKGASTVIAAPSGECYVQADAPAWTGTAGSGDVLAGIIGAVVAMFQARAEQSGENVLSKDLALAAAIGVHIHGRAASFASRRELHDQRGLGIPIAASDIIDSVPNIMDEILNPWR
ncbi:NAD(P)H-hydrate epimerase [Arcanobacterium ihumii]|uniref:NAD(P)H-hydrate epimerase n=1 Tax=Arcanobacterium ihumii TaxID=2138162 RepID=UPI000F529F48|nr:NAD(P)H-hydrate epimerase [Arcanobacterium ihumii]